jgi:tripartite-type tricarboxylate transporter receptor subunit TctC
MKRIHELAVIAMLACATAAHALAAAFPERPIRLIVPTTAGSVPDVIARLVAERMGEELRQPVVVENRPGAGGTIGLAAVAKSTPDGYTLGVLSLPYVIAPAMLSTTSYDTETDLVPVAVINWNYAFLCVRGDAPYQSVADLVAAARARPRDLRYSSQGIATPGHLAIKLLERQSAIELTHVPYKGGPAAVNALLAGEVDVHVGGLAVLSGQLRSKGLRALATMAPHRLAEYPDVPTMEELGYAGVELRDWQGIVAPAGTPHEIVARLSAAIARVVGQQAVQARLAALGMEGAGIGPEGFREIVRTEAQRWRRVIREEHITAE